MPRKRTPPLPIEWLQIQKHRDPRTGKYVRPDHPRAVRELYEIATRQGKAIEGAKFIPVLTEHVVLKRLTPDMIDRPEDPPNQGMISWALAESNIFTKLKGAEKIEVIVKGLDGRDKARRFRETRELETDKRLQDLLPGMIVAMFHKRGWRTSYPLDVVERWKERKHKRKTVAKLRPLHDVSIVVKILKKQRG